MKTYNQLSEQKQKQAKKIALDKLLNAILEGTIRFKDKLNKNNLQAKIEAACKKAEKMRTPWFANEYILDTCKDELESISHYDAENAFYPEAFESIIELG